MTVLRDSVLLPSNSGRENSDGLFSLDFFELELLSLLLLNFLEKNVKSITKTCSGNKQEIYIFDKQTIFIRQFLTFYLMVGTCQNRLGEAFLKSTSFSRKKKKKKKERASHICQTKVQSKMLN